jgi:hypothetical protein
MTVYGDQTSFRTTASISLRSTVSTAIVNELRGGWQYSPINFFGNITPGAVHQPGRLRDLDAVWADAGLADGLRQRAAALQDTELHDLGPVQLAERLAQHAVRRDYTRVTDSADNRNAVPFMSIAFQTNFDPAAAMFNTTNFPGATQAELNSAASLYALLTGRVSSITATGNLNNAGDQYVYNGPLFRKVQQDDYSFYAQDTWRWKPTVTFTLGARYQFTLPMTSSNGVFTTISTSDSCGISGFGTGPTADGATDRFCNMFQPGSFNNPTQGTPTYVAYSADTKGYSTDYSNIGPVAGIAWRPNVQSGFMRKILGDPELATINGGFTRSFVRTRFDQFLNVYNGNPGQTTSATRSTAAGAFPIVPAGESWPILLSQKDRLGAPTGMITTPQFPINATFGNGAWFFNPDIQVPWTDSWNVSFQRSITKDTVVELRYQGNRATRPGPLRTGTPPTSTRRAGSPVLAAWVSRTASSKRRRPICAPTSSRAAAPAWPTWDRAPAPCRSDPAGAPERPVPVQQRRDLRGRLGPDEVRRQRLEQLHLHGCAESLLAEPVDLRG